jgi:ADP-heptose:LPS heptosyltransferase
MSWTGVRKLLCVRLDSIGDVLMSTPAIRACKESFDCHVTLLTSASGIAVAALVPEIDARMPFAAPWMKPVAERGDEQMIERLKAERFDAAVIFTVYSQSPLPAAYLCYLAGIPLRLAASIDGPGSLLTTRHRHPDQTMHEVERGLDLVSAVGIRGSDDHLVLRVPLDARPEIAPLLAGARPLVVVHPGCSMPARTYPWRMYVAAIDRLVDEMDARVVVTGAPDEAPVVESILSELAPRAGARTTSVAGSLSFPAFCALIEAADLTITNNTGPMHMAAALSTPVVALFALTNPPEQWGPWRVPHRMLWHEVPCRLCYSRICPTTHDCLTRVPPERVVQAARELLDESAALAGNAELGRLREAVA